MKGDESGFDGWLERGLAGELDQVTSRPAPLRPRYAESAPSGRRGLTVFSGIGAVLATKVVPAFAVTALAVGATGAAVSTVVTGRADPQAWSQEVRNVVADLGTRPAEPSAGPTASAPEPSPGAAGDVTAAASLATQPPPGSGDGSKIHRIPAPATDPEPNESPRPHPSATPKPHPSATPRAHPTADPDDDRDLPPVHRIGRPHPTPAPDGGQAGGQVSGQLSGEEAGPGSGQNGGSGTDPR